MVLPVELRQLRAFVAVAEQKSFTRASERLHLVQSAVSAAVRSLERELSVALFDRTTRSVELTDAGTVLLAEARTVLAAATVARDAVEQTKTGLRGAVTLGVMQTWARTGLSVPEVIIAFQRHHPLVQVSASHVGGSAELAEALRIGTVDLGILSLPEPLPDLELTELSVEPMVLACSADHPLAGVRRTTLSELDGETFVDWPKGWGTRLATERAFAHAGATRTVRFEINDTATLVEFVRAGAGLALLPRSFTAGQQDIVTVALDGEQILFRTLLAAPSRRRQTAATAALAAAVLRATTEGRKSISDR